MEFLLLFVAPFLQIILSVLRLVRKIQLPLFAIFGFALFAGIICSFIAMEIILDAMSRKAHGEGICGMPGMAALFCGIFITIVTTPIIAMICYFINRYLQKTAEADAPATIPNKPINL